MKTYNNSSQRYAVIQVRQSDGGIERFVIAYKDERVLRELLAKPSILATGFLSRDEATKKLFTAGNRVPLLNIICGLRVAPGWQLRMLRMRAISRLQRPVGALQAMNSAIHLAGAALHKIKARLTHAQQRLAPAVQ
jgi:hypothetical protein